MGDFLLCFLQYFLIFIVLVAVGCIGAAIGIKLRKNKNKKGEIVENEEK